MDEINKLIKKIEDKDIENSKFEIEQNELQEDVRQTEKCIGQKIKILRRLNRPISHKSQCINSVVPQLETTSTSQAS